MKLHACFSVRLPFAPFRVVANCECTLTAQGARVTAHFNTKVEPLGPLIDEFGLERVRPLQANLSREDDVARLFAADELLASNAEGIVAFGPVQVLVVNHGWYDGRDVPIGKMTLEQW